MMKMMRWLAIAGLLLLALPGMGMGQDADFTGTVSIGGRGVHQNCFGARFLEYRDIDDGVFGEFDIKAFRDGNYLLMEGRNLGVAEGVRTGLDDQSFRLDGGSYGSFRYSLYYSEIPHNLSFNARTIYTSGVGGDNLTYAALSTNPATWTVFDYQKKRKHYGVGGELSLGTPWYFSLNLDRQESDGAQPFGLATGSASTGGLSGGSYFVELPAPVEYKATTLRAEAGYRTRQVVASIDGTLSTFADENRNLSFTNPISALAPATNPVVLAPDNEYGRVGAQVVLRLPLRSTLVLKGSYALLESEEELITGQRFNGDITYTTASVALNINPTKQLDAKVYYNYLDKDNNGNTFLFDGEQTRIFDYRKHNAGFDIGYRLPARTKLTVGYDVRNVDRVREDAETTTDHKVYAHIRNSALDFLVAKVRYEHLERNSDFEHGTTGTSLTDQTSIRRFIRPFDSADKTQDSVKAGVEVYPLEHLDLGVEYTFRVNDYEKTVLGLTDDERHEVYLDAAYELPERFRLNAFAGYVYRAFESDHRRYGSGDSTDPAAGTAGGAYNWSQKLTSDYWVFGVGTEIPLVKDRLTLAASCEHHRSDGHNDLVREDGTVLQDISSSDDYRKKVLEAKLIYKATPDLDLTVGNLYEKYDYDDLQFEDYLYIYGSGSSTSFLSGAYLDHDYEANVTYLTASYRF